MQLTTAAKNFSINRSRPSPVSQKGHVKGGVINTRAPVMIFSCVCL